MGIPPEKDSIILHLDVIPFPFVIALGELMCSEFFRVGCVGYHPRAIR